LQGAGVSPGVGARNAQQPGTIAVSKSGKGIGETEAGDVEGWEKAYEACSAEK
jgi:hypothetical protein